MSDFKIEDLTPAPFFAHFLEGQFSKDLTAEEMQALRGGSSTLAGSSDQEGIPVGELPDLQALIRRFSERGIQVPGYPPATNVVTQAYPSDGDAAYVPF
jgi:hypothetical protein